MERQKLGKVLVSGASGFVGTDLCQALIDRDVVVVGAVRKISGKFPIKSSSFSQIAVGDIGADTDWSEALSGVDIVFHLAARVHVMHETASSPLSEFRKVNVHATENLARLAASSGVKRLIYVSSIKVNGEATINSTKFAEATPPSPHDPYGITKWEAEQVLKNIAKETGLEVVIVRPPLIYGAGVKGNFAKMLAMLFYKIPLPLASVHNLRSFIYVKNLSDALILCATHPAAAGKTYMISDGEDISTPNLLRKLGNELGVPVRLFPCPQPLLYLAGKLMGKSDQLGKLLGSLEIDSARIRRDLNWVPPYSLQQGLRATADWYRNQQRT